MDLYAQNLSLVMADAGSNKRYQSLVRGRYLRPAESTKVPFDNRVRDVITKYSYDPDEIFETTAHLDAVGYGARHNPKQLIEALDRFEGEHASDRTWMRTLKCACENMDKMLRRNVPYLLKPVLFADDEQIFDSLPKEDAHAGFAFLQTGLRTKGEYRGRLYTSWTDALANVREHGTHGFPILPGSRLQCSGGYVDGVAVESVKHKERLVNMVDYRQIISEMMFSIPVQRALSDVSFYTGSRNPDMLNHVIQFRRGWGEYWISLDYSAFDQSIPGWLIKLAFERLEKMFDQRAFNDVRWIWDAIVYDFIHAPIVGPKGLVYRENGVPSGSMFTQIIDTIVNWLMIESWRMMKKEETGKSLPMQMLICGDDNLIFLKWECDPRDVGAEMLSYISHNFGVTGNVDKLDYGDCDYDDPKFLSRVWRFRGAWRDRHELIAHACYPERYRDYKRNPQLSGEMIVWSYILAYPEGMGEFIDIKSFIRDNQFEIPKWSCTALSEYVPGYLSFQVRYVEKTIANALLEYMA